MHCGIKCNSADKQCNWNIIPRHCQSILYHSWALQTLLCDVHQIKCDVCYVAVHTQKYSVRCQAVAFCIHYQDFRLCCMHLNMWPDCRKFDSPSNAKLSRCVRRQQVRCARHSWECAGCRMHLCASERVRVITYVDADHACDHSDDDDCEQIGKRTVPITSNSAATISSAC